jgi:hypothetical protein
MATGFTSDGGIKGKLARLVAAGARPRGRSLGRVWPEQRSTEPVAIIGISFGPLLAGKREYLLCTYVWSIHVNGGAIAVRY